VLVDANKAIYQFIDDRSEANRNEAIQKLDALQEMMQLEYNDLLER
jgi:hypothetical protein